MNSDKKPQEPAGEKPETELEKERRLLGDEFFVSMGLIRMSVGQY